MLAAAAGAVAACGRPPAPAPAPLDHDAYVWQRAWTGAVGAAVAAAPVELRALRVLALEVAPTGARAWAGVDAAALATAGRPVIAVVRIDGSRPIAELGLEPVLDRIDAWRRRGVDVAGIEIDHDCATAALADYAGWLARSRPPAPLRWSVTALPSWAPARDLAAVAAAVDELVVQVHAVRAPVVFAAGAARADLAAFAAAIGGARPLRVALPTYRVVVGGTPRAADPVEIAAFVRALEQRREPGVVGVTWFRLPTDADLATWRTATLRAVIAGAPLSANVTVMLEPRGLGRYDVVVANPGTLDAPYPSIELAGGDHDLAPPPAHRVVAAGTRRVVGWASEGARLHAP